jgi:uncharacterized membrane protein YfcA
MQTPKILILVIGAIVGFLSGLLGKGGSAITTPALQIFASLNPFSALASPLPATLPTALSASLAYRGKGLLRKKVILGAVLSGIPATLAGSYFSDWLKGNVLMILTAVFVLTLGCSFFISSNLEGGTESDGVVPLWKILTVGFGVGFLSGLLANSGGVLFGPLFIRFLKMPVKKALACSLVVSAGLAIPGTLAHWWLGHIDWAIVVLLSIASIPFSYLGAWTALRMKSEKLEKIFACFLIIFGAIDLFYSLAN